MHYLVNLFIIIIFRRNYKMFDGFFYIFIYYILKLLFLYYSIYITFFSQYIRMDHLRYQKNKKKTIRK